MDSIVPSHASVRPIRLAIGGLIALAAAMGIGRFIYTPILPPMADGLSLTKGEAGLIASANFLGYLAGALAASSRSLPGTPRSWLLWALAVSALTTGAMGLAGGMSQFLFLRFAGGVASALVLVFASALILERLSASGRGALSAVHFSGVGFGIAVSALIPWEVTATGGSWRLIWYGGGLLSLVAVCAVAALVPSLKTEQDPAVGVAARAQRSRIWPLVAAYALFGFGYVVTATFIVAIVRGSPEIERFEQFVWLLVGLAAIPSVAAWTMLGRRYGVIQAFAIACVVEAIGVVSSVVWISTPGVLIAAAFLGGTFMGITALGLMAARALSGNQPRRVLATMTAAFGLGQIIGPLVAGYGFDLTGSFLVPSLIAAAALCLAAALSALALRR